MPAVAKARKHSKRPGHEKLDVAINRVHAARKAIDDANRAKEAAARMMSDAKQGVMDTLQHASTGTALYIAGPSSKIYIGDKAIETYTEDKLPLMHLKDALDVATVAVCGKTFTLLGPLPNVAQLLFAYGEHEHTTIDPSVSLKRNDDTVLSWDDTVQAGTEYTTQHGVVPYKRINCFEYTNEDGTRCAAEPCLWCPNPLCKRVNVLSMFDKDDPARWPGYTPGSPVYSPR